MRYLPFSDSTVMTLADVKAALGGVSQGKVQSLKSRGTINSDRWGNDRYNTASVKAHLHDEIESLEQKVKQLKGKLRDVKREEATTLRKGRAAKK